MSDPIAPSVSELTSRCVGEVGGTTERPIAALLARSVLVDLDTPVSAFLKVTEGEQEQYSFLLESVEGGERWARYSYVGLDPAFVIRATGNQVTRCDFSEDRPNQVLSVQTQECADPLRYLEAALGAYSVVPFDSPAFPLPPFSMGAVGFFGFDAVRYWERLPKRVTPSDVPTMVFAVPRILLVFDNLRHKLLVLSLVLIPKGSGASDIESLYIRGTTRIRETLERLFKPLSPGNLPEKKQTPEREPMTERMAVPQKAAYTDAVSRIREYIYAGDCIQVVPSQRFPLDYQGDEVTLYRALRAENPSPYLYCLRYPEVQVVGASPEVLVRVDEGVAMTAPIAGTRKRGETEEEDRRLEVELVSDPKERAEHVMLVDLARNDLGRIARPGSVEVRSFQQIHRFSHVMHMVSEVSAQLQEGKSAYDAVRACFPAGTLSGAPKVRAMEIIEELEPFPREIYGGALGYFDFSGNAELCIVIRTAWRHGSTWCVQVGSGVVADSDPDAEYEEILNKARAVVRAAALAGRGL